MELILLFSSETNNNYHGSIPWQNSTVIPWTDSIHFDWIKRRNITNPPAQRLLVLKQSTSIHKRGIYTLILGSRTTWGIVPTLHVEWSSMDTSIPRSQRILWPILPSIYLPRSQTILCQILSPMDSLGSQCHLNPWTYRLWYHFNSPSLLAPNGPSCSVPLLWVSSK